MMTFSWPLPHPYSIMYGEMSVMLGLLWLATAWSLAKGWSLMPLGIYALPAGIAAILIGLRIMNLEMTQKPLLSGVGFILTGLGGVGTLPGLLCWERGWFRRIGALMMFAAAAIWALTGYMAYWSHLATKG